MRALVTPRTLADRVATLVLVVGLAIALAVASAAASGRAAPATLSWAALCSGEIVERGEHDDHDRCVACLIVFAPPAPGAPTVSRILSLDPAARPNGPAPLGWCPAPDAPPTGSRAPPGVA